MILASLIRHSLNPLKLNVGYDEIIKNPLKEHKQIFIFNTLLKIKFFKFQPCFKYAAGKQRTLAAGTCMTTSFLVACRFY